MTLPLRHTFTQKIAANELKDKKEREKKGREREEKRQFQSF